MRKLQIISIITVFVIFFNVIMLDRLQSIAVYNIDVNKALNELDEEYLNNENLAIGIFFTVNIEKSSSENEIEKNVDQNIQLYVTNNGKDFTYIGETGIMGRDANMIYINGIFYMAVTKGGNTDGQMVVNIFKSKDLLNWTNITYEGNGIFNYPYRYKIRKV